MTTEEALVIFVGDDWAEDHHDVHLMDESGARLASRRLPEGLAGIGEFHQLLARHAEEPEQVVIGIETDRGLWVEGRGGSSSAAASSAWASPSSIPRAYPATPVNNGTAGRSRSSRSMACRTRARKPASPAAEATRALKITRSNTWGQIGVSNRVMPPSQRIASWTSPRCHAASASTCAAPRRTTDEPVG